MTVIVVSVWPIGVVSCSSEGGGSCIESSFDCRDFGEAEAFESSPGFPDTEAAAVDAHASVDASVDVDADGDAGIDGDANDGADSADE